MTLLSVLPIVLSPAAMIAQQGSRNWLFTGFGAMRTNTTSQGDSAHLVSPYPRETSLYTFHDSSSLASPPSVPLQKIQNLGIHIACDRGAALP